VKSSAIAPSSIGLFLLYIVMPGSRPGMTA
jgi:hypothetical protein